MAEEKRKKKKFWRKTDWESFKFWKPDDTSYHRKRWLFGIFGFGLGMWIGMGTTYGGFLACAGLALFGFIGAIIDAVGIARFERTHEEILMREAMEEEYGTREDRLLAEAKAEIAAEDAASAADKQEESNREEEDDEEDYYVVDPQLLSEIEKEEP